MKKQMFKTISVLIAVLLVFALFQLPLTVGASNDCVLDATNGMVSRSFDFSNSIQYTNTTGQSLEECPQATLFVMRLRCTGESRDIHGYEMDVRVNEANYYPAQNYVNVDTYNDWTVVQVQTHSAPPAADGQNTLTINVFEDVKIEFDYIRVYNGWNTNTLMTDLDFYTTDDDQAQTKLVAAARFVGNEQYVDVTLNSRVSASSYKYGIEYDPTILQYVSSSAAAGTSGISASATNVVTPAIDRMVIDATQDETQIDFDFSNSIQYTNTTGDALSSMPQPTYFSMRVRCTGETQDIHGYEFHVRINEAEYYPSHHYRNVETLNEWTVVSFSTHSNPPAADGQNTLSVMVYPGVVMEIDYIRVYRGWDTSSPLLTELKYAGENEPSPAVGTVNVSASSYANKMENIATSTFRVIGDIEGTTALNLSVSKPTNVTASGTVLALNNNFGKISARTDDGDVRFALSLPTDSSGEYYVTDEGKTVRPVSKGYLLALGYHAPQNMTVSTPDPYIRKVPVSRPQSNVIGGVRYTVAVTDPTVESKNYIASRFYVGYTENGQTKYAYSKPFSVSRIQLEALDTDQWRSAVNPGGSAAVTINNMTAVQENWQGANAVAQGYIYNNGYTASQINTEISRMKSMGINMVRSYFDETFNASYNSVRNIITYTYSRDRMTALKNWLQVMKDNDIEVALNMSWSISDIFEQTYTCYDGWNNNSGSAFVNALNAYYKRNGKEKTIAAYGAWVNESVDYLINRCGYTNITHLIMFTEPGVSGNGNDYWLDYTDMVASADAALKDAGNRNSVKIVGPNVAIGDSTHTDSVTNDLLHFDSLKDYIDVYSFHFYAPHWPGLNGLFSKEDAYTDNYQKYTAMFDQFVSFANERGKSYWMDEYNYSFRSDGITAVQEDSIMGTQYAQEIIAAMNNGVENSLLWQLFEIKWPGRSSTTWEFENGVHVIGLAPTLTESAVPYAPYYAYAMLSRYMGERGSDVYAGSGTSGVYATMVQNDDGTQSIAVVNTNSTAMNVTTNLNRSLDGATMYRICYDPEDVYPDSSATMINPDSMIVGINNTFTDVIPANSFVIYTTIGRDSYQSDSEAGEYVLGGSLTAQMKTDSVLYAGNCARLSEKMSLLKNGETVKIAFIGGSITEGYFADPQLTNRYSAQLVSLLQQKYPQATVTELNAGIGATTSYLGVHRAQAVLAQNPDIVVVDFAVNDDAGYALYQASFESLINQIWNCESEPAVIGVAMAGKVNGQLQNSQNDELEIAQKYGVPMLSYKDMIVPLLNNDVINWSNLQFDQVHPNTVGHGLIAKMIAAYFDKVAKSNVTDTEPDFGAIADKNAPYVNGTMLTVHNSQPSMRRFTANTTDYIHGFAGYWTTTESTAQLVFSNVSAQYIGVAFEEVDSNTTAAPFVVLVDGVQVAEIDPNAGVGHAMGKQVYVGDTVGTHKVTIKTTAAGSCKIIGLLVS